MWKRSKLGLHSFHIQATYSFYVGYSSLCSRPGIPDLLLHRNPKDYLLDHVIFAEILCCFTLVSCTMNIRFMIASSLFHVGHLLHIGPLFVKLYSLTVMRIVIDDD